MQCEVAVLGGGLAGMAVSLHLARAGMRVLCVDADPVNADPVGESLDWSAPDLLAAIGLPMQRLLELGVATSKRHVILRLPDGKERHYVPGEWLGRAPFHVKLNTLHVDRNELDRALRECVVKQPGIELFVDRAVGIEREGKRIVSVSTQAGRSIHAKWFIDASGGTARLFARAFQLSAKEYGPGKVAMWQYFPTTSFVEGTTLYASQSSDGYMEWIWQIPVRPDMVSVGCVASGDSIKQKRQDGLTPEQIYHAHLQSVPALAQLLHDKERAAPSITSFRCRVHDGVSGPNWLVVGEAASMVDPMTSNGVTAALRHASEAAKLILRARDRSCLPRLAALAYAWRVRDLARFFNCGIERVMYQRTIRARIGALQAGDVYTVPAWVMNLLYARLQPASVLTSAAFGMVLGFFRGAAVVFSWLCRNSPSIVEGSAL